MKYKPITFVSFLKIFSIIALITLAIVLPIVLIKKASKGPTCSSKTTFNDLIPNCTIGVTPCPTGHAGNKNDFDGVVTINDTFSRDDCLALDTFMFKKKIDITFTKNAPGKLDVSNLNTLISIRFLFYFSVPDMFDLTHLPHLKTVNLEFGPDFIPRCTDLIPTHITTLVLSFGTSMPNTLDLSSFTSLKQLELSFQDTLPEISYGSIYLYIFKLTIMDNMSGFTIPSLPFVRDYLQIYAGNSMVLPSDFQTPKRCDFGGIKGRIQTPCPSWITKPSCYNSSCK